MLKLCSLDQFKEALIALDDLLIKVDAKPLEVRAIGGFALMFHGIRQDGETVDIDSLGRLCLRKPSGEMLTLSAGEISLRV